MGFDAQCACYLIMCLLYPYTFEHASRKLQFAGAMIGMGCMHLLGPLSHTQHSRQNMDYNRRMVGVGVFQVFIFVPIIPEMLERLQVALKVHENDDDMYGKLNDKVNDSYGFVYALT